MNCTAAHLPATQLEAAATCEAAGAPLYLAESNGWLAAFFAWLGRHDFAVPAVGPSVPYSVAITQHWDAGVRKVQAERAELYLAVRKVWKAGPADAAVVTQAAQAAAVSAGIDAAIIQHSTVDVLCRTYQQSMPAVDTVIAGLLAQEISNAISRTRQPICNWLVYNGWDGEARAWHSAAFKPKPVALAAAPVPVPAFGDDSDSEIVAIVDDPSADVVDIFDDDSD